MKRSIKLSILAVVMALSATSMFAGTASTVNTNNVFTTVVGSCQWTTPLTMAFPNYDPFTVAATTQTTAVAFKCVKKTNATDSYKIWFSKTAGNMVNGANNLAYTLTDGVGAALPITALASTAVAGTPGVGALAGYSFTVKGSIAGQQDVPTGLYQDTVIANVEY
ncbi:MAG TPA: spore coat protein U domain-containing protein [Thermoanaerobaculia bacterium]